MRKLLRKRPGLAVLAAAVLGMAALAFAPAGRPAARADDYPITNLQAFMRVDGGIRVTANVAPGYTVYSFSVTGEMAAYTAGSNTPYGVIGGIWNHASASGDLNNGLFDCSATFMKNVGIAVRGEFIVGREYELKLTLSQVDPATGSRYVESLIFVYSNIPPYAEFLGIVPLPPDPALEHHTFVGWYFDALFTQPYDGSPIYSHTNLYAKFVPVTYYVTYVTGVPNITYPDRPVTALTAAGALPTPNRTGYTFLGWFTDPECTQEYEPILSMTGNVTLYAGWERIILTVTFYANGAVYTTVSVPWGSTLFEAVSAANGGGPAVVIGMYSDSNLTGAISGNMILLSDTNVYAELGDGDEVPPGFFQKAGDWFRDNWPYFPASAGGVLAGMAILYLIQKKKGVI